MSKILRFTCFCTVVYTVATKGVLGFSGCQQNGYEWLNDSETLNCPPWFLPRAITGKDSGIPSLICSCTSNRQEIIRCDEFNQKSFLSLNYCVTTHNQTILAGPCPYHFGSNQTMGFWSPLPENTTAVNEYMCGHLNREGLLCGQCKPGFGVSAYSLDLRCSQCSKKSIGFLLFLFTSIILQTGFFLLVTIFRISVTRAELSTFVLFCQILVSTGAELLGNQLLKSRGFYTMARLYRATFVFYGMWNLEFFSSILPAACISENLSTLQAISLRYVSAFYPLLLIFLTYIILKLYEYDFKPVSIITRPIHKCCVRLRSFYDLQFSLVHTFTTFLLLSYTKVAYVSYSLLAPTQIYDASGTLVTSRAWYFNAAITLFKGDHVPYGILAMVILFVYNILPVILLLVYPLRPFRKCLHKLKLNSVALDLFMDTFQGCYKDGASNTRDLRSFSCLYFLLRLSFIIVRLSASYGWHWGVVMLLFTSATVVIASFKPYKRNIHNVIDIVMLGVLMLVFYFYLMMIIHSSFTGQFPLHLFYVNITLCLLPALYFLAFCVYHLVNAIKLPERWKRFYKECWTKTKDTVAKSRHTSINLGSFFSQSNVDSDAVSTVTSSVICPYELNFDESEL